MVVLVRKMMILAAILVLGFAATHAPRAHPKSDPGQDQPRRPSAPELTPIPSLPRLGMPKMDSTRGRALFVSKGCVACHAINGVGGHDASTLDAHSMPEIMNPFEFAAKMWRMAPVMIQFQEEALGEQIDFTGAELADIIAFVHDDEAQHHFSEADITPPIRRLMDHEHGARSGPKAHAEEIGHGQGGGKAGHGHSD
jgi:cytochrome c553